MEDETIPIADYIDAILRRWWLLPVGSALAGVVAVVLGLYSSPSAPTIYPYEATTVVLMEGAEALAQFPELVETRDVLEDVTHDLGLALSVAQLREKVSASSPGNAPLLRIKVEDPDPALAVTIADGVAQSLIAHVSSLQQSRSAAIQEQLSAQMDDLDSGGTAWANEGAAEALALLARRPYVISPAEASESPAGVSPTSTGTPILRNLFIGVFLGGILATVVAIGLEHLGSPVRSPEVLERQFRLDRLGILPRWTRAGNSTYQLMAKDRSDPVGAEAMREVAASIAFSSGSKDIRTLAITSSDTGDGRSSLAANLGMALASIWRNVVLVDGDLRRPSLHHYFGLANNPGLSDFLANTDLEVADVIQETACPGLRVITGGAISDSPASLLIGPRMDYLWERLAEVADLVLVDTPPMRATVDGAIIASQAQGVVLLVNGETSRQETVKGALAKLEKAGTPLLGYIWNRMSPRRFDRYSGSRRYFQGLNQKSYIHPGPDARAETNHIKSLVNGAGAQETKIQRSR